VTPVLAQQVTGELGAPSATTTISGQQLPPPRSEVRRGDHRRRHPSPRPGWPPRVVPAQGRAQCAADHDRRQRVCRAEHLRRRDPTPALDASREAGCVTRTFTPRRCARRRGRRSSPSQPPFGGASAWSARSPPASRATTRSSRSRRAPSAPSSSTTATRPRGSARTTTRRSSPTARRGPSSNGPTAWASSTSTASSAATPASGSRTCSATRRRSFRSRAIRAGT